MHPNPHPHPTEKPPCVPPEEHSTDTNAGSFPEIRLPGSTYSQRLGELSQTFTWIKVHSTFSQLKPVVRCTVAAFICLFLFAIPSVETTIGQASFLLLLAPVLSPPSDPFLAVFEREVITLSLVLIAWAWMCLGIFLADLARTNRNPQADLFEAVSTAEYIELGPSIILAVFSLGSGAFLYIKAAQGPGPYFFAAILACVLINISVTTAASIPYPAYSLGQAVILPLAVYSAIALLCSIFIFPTSISTLFKSRIINVVSPLILASELQAQMLQIKPSDNAFNEKARLMCADIEEADAALTPLASAARLLPADLTYCRFAPTDFQKFHDLARRLVLRANGMSLYFSLIDPTRPRFPITPLPSRVATPGSRTPATTRPPSIISEDHLPIPEFVHDKKKSRESSPGPDSPSTPSSTTRHHRHLHQSLLHVALIHRMEPMVGLFESQRYMDLENTRFHEPDAEANTEHATALLNESCRDLHLQVKEGLTHIVSWLATTRHRKLGLFRGYKKYKERRAEALVMLKETQRNMAATLSDFEDFGRMRVLDMYRPVFEAEHSSMIPHRHLFHCFVYQYHLFRFSKNVLEMLDEIVRLESERPHARLWTPAERLFKWTHWEIGEGAQFNADENPEVVPGLHPSTSANIRFSGGERNPDALPPRNMIEWAFNEFYLGIEVIAHGNVLFALKAALLTMTLCLPSLIQSSSAFAYDNRFFWGIVMAQLTLTRFRGDTVFGMLARIFATFIGCTIGMALWYAGNGLGSGNPYGFVAVGAVSLPFIFFSRLYFPASPIAVIIGIVTIFLVTGYSYQQKHIPLPGNPGLGWEVAWRRFVLVTAGVFSAFVFSLLPPSSTIRSHQRKSLSTALAEIGSIYCAVASYANSHRDSDTDKIITSLSAIRAQLHRFEVMRTYVSYEYSFRGRWPGRRYNEVSELLIQISYNLSHLLSVIQQMEPVWAQAFVKRTKLADSSFQGDVLAVITMLSAALKTGTALPQITPCPLIDRFTFKDNAEEDYGLPRELNITTLSDEQYLYFCVGVASSFALMTRFDRLMFAVKEIVGERYFIDTIGLNV